MLLFSSGTFIQPRFRKDGSEIVHMETVTQTRTDYDGWALWAIAGYHQFAVAVVVASDCVLQLSAGGNLAARRFQLDYLVSVLCFSAVSIVHFIFSFVFVVYLPSRDSHLLIFHSYELSGDTRQSYGDYPFTTGKF